MRPSTTTRRRTSPQLSAVFAVALVGALLAPGCSTNPATGKTQLNMFSESQEIQMGREADEQIVQQMGLYDSPSLQSYIQRLGESLARESERPELPWTFRVVDDPVVNAFALPRGYIYVTRGILSHLNSEAELAGVLGHEIGHVTARHGVNQVSKAQLAQVGLVVGSIAYPEVAREFGGLAQTGLGLLFLKFGRDDERQADDLGFRYMAREGYPPAHMAEVFSVLQAVSQREGGGRVPAWMSTHPDPGNRAASVQALASELPPELANADPRSRPYLHQLDGLTFGANPREGYFRGDTFYHPDLAFSFDIPRGWKGVNQKQQVIAISPNEDAVVGLTLANARSAEDAARQFFSQHGIETGRQWLRSGVSRTFRANTQQGALLGGAAFFEYDGRVYRFLGYTGERNWSRYDDELGRPAATFERLTDRRFLDVQPRRIELVEIDRAMDLREFDRRYPSSVDLEALGLINHVGADGRLPSGSVVKRVTGQDPSKI